MTRKTWREGINHLMEQKEFKVTDRILLSSICKDLDKKNVSYEIFNTHCDWTVKISE